MANETEWEWYSTVGHGSPKWENVLVFCRGERRIAYKSDKGVWYAQETELVLHPTHWARLPDGPKKERTDGE